MTETLHANIFFLVTSLSVIIVTAGLVWLLWHLIPVARDVRAIVAKLRRAGDDLERDFQAVRNDFHVLRSTVKEEGTKGKLLVDMALGFLQRKFTPKRPRKKSEPTEENQNSN